MRKYPSIDDIQRRITSDSTVCITYQANEIRDIIHPYSISGYEYLSGEFIAFLERFRTILPEKIPLVLKITGKKFTEEEKEIIDKAIWMHYGLYLSEASEKFKNTRFRMAVYLIMMILSSSLLFIVANNSEEVIINYGYILFWFFGYRLLIHLALDCRPIYKEYQWYRRVSSLKLIFANDENQDLDAEKIYKEVSYYQHKADKMIKKSKFVNQVLLEDNYVDLSCRIESLEDVLCQSGVKDMEIISYDMADYLMSALPFILQKDVTKLTIEGKSFNDEEKRRIVAAIRNQLAFTISQQDAERNANKGVSILFTVGLCISTVALYVWGKEVNLAVHEFIVLSFWFFADYLLEFVILSRKDIKYQKKTLEKLANMEITFASYDKED